MSNIAAGIGRGQLKVLEQRVAKKRYIYEFYKRELKGLEGVQFMPVNEWNEPNYWLSCIIVNGKVKPIDIIAALEAENIESRPIWKPMHMQPFFKEYEFFSQYEELDDFRELVAAAKEDSSNSVINPNVEYGHFKTLSVAEDIFKRGVCLPSDTKITDEDLYRVCEIIKRLWE